MKTQLDRLMKCSQSLKNHVSRGNTVNGARSQELIDKYEELRQEVDQDVWQEFCRIKRYSVYHDAYDCFA